MKKFNMIDESFICDKCGIIKKNKIADDDNFEKILEIMKNKE